MDNLEQYFDRFRQNIIGIDRTFQTPFGEKKIVYCDWTASGRLYGPLEERMRHEIMPLVGNTHTETTVTGSAMTMAYHTAMKKIKKHVGARESDVIISSNSGMTGVINKFQRILGLKVHEKFRDTIHLSEEDTPIIFVTHMEHHSNQTSWLETIGEVRIIRADENGHVNLDHLEYLLEKYKNRKTKIAAVTSCSNVTGICTPYHKIAEIMHNHGGLCFVDFAASAPYIEINMRPDNELQHLDAIYFSPHKFLGGPGSSGILIFDPRLYTNKIPDNPGGGTVDWTNPWGEHRYIEDIEAREDGGTPSFLQTMKVALCVKLKEEMGVENILSREKEINERLWEGFDSITNLHVMADNFRERLGIFSFYIDDLHYNLAAKLLNDRCGIQVRGGCTCAGTYGHYLLNVKRDQSFVITSRIDEGDLSAKPGWVRLSIHPTTTNTEIDYVISALREICANHEQWSKDYEYFLNTNEFKYKGFREPEPEMVNGWFERELG